MTSNYQINTHFGDVSAAPLGPHDLKGFFSPIEKKITYINNLSEPVTIGTRDGLKFVLSPQYNLSANGLIIRVEITINSTQKTDIQKVLSAVDDSAPQELKVLRETFAKQIKVVTHRASTVMTIDYTVHTNTLREYGGSIYFHEVDLVVSLLGFDNTPPHPFSEEGRRLNIINTSTDNTEKDFFYSIKIVDNGEKYGPRYININNQVFKIDTVKDNSKKDGVYITRTKEFNSTLSDSNQKEHLHYSIDSEELSIFKSAEEARVYGDINTNRKRELAELEHQLNLQKAELQAIKSKNEMDMIERNKEKLILEMEKDTLKQRLEEQRQDYEQRLKYERDRQKDYFDERSYRRKDYSEMVKFIPAIIVGIGAIFIAMKGNGGTSK